MTSWLNIPSKTYQLAFFLLALLTLLWLPVEDTDFRRPLSLSILFASVLTIRAWTKPVANPCGQIYRRHMIPAAAGGLGIPILAVFLMIFKSGLHGHGFPDFTISQLIAVLKSTPIFAGLGIVIGWIAAQTQWSDCQKGD